MSISIRLTLVLWTFFYTVSAQNVDTLYAKRHYNFIGYFPAESVRALDSDTVKGQPVFCFGNMSDSLKDGQWIYFYPSGERLASGSFKKGFKVGKWKYYYTASISITLNFLQKDCVTGRIIFDEVGFPVIIDKLKADNTAYYELINGQQRPKIMGGGILLE